MASNVVTIETKRGPIEIGPGSILRHRDGGKWRVIVDPGSERLDWRRDGFHYYQVEPRGKQGKLAVRSDVWSVSKDSLRPSRCFTLKTLISWAGGKEEMSLESDPEAISKICTALRGGYGNHKISQDMLDGLAKAGLTVTAP